MTKRSNRKERRYAKISIAKKMVTAQSSLSMVSSSTGTASEPISSEILVSELDTNVIDEEELVSLSDTKENNQTDVNSLDNSPSSTTSSKKLHVSPVAIPIHMTNAHTQSLSHEAPNIPSYVMGHNHDSVAIITLPSTHSCDISARRLSHDMSVSSTTSDQLAETPVYKKILSRKKRKRNQVTSSADALKDGRRTVSDEKPNSCMTYNGACRVIKMEPVEADSFLGKSQEVSHHEDLTQTIKVEAGETEETRKMELEMVNQSKPDEMNVGACELDTLGHRQDSNGSSELKVDEPISSTSGQPVKLEVDETASVEADETASVEADETASMEADETASVEADETASVEAQGSEITKKKFPNSFEELIVMHFERELNVAEMVESMGCLEQDNEANETQLTHLMDQISLLENINKRLDRSSF